MSSQATRNAMRRYQIAGFAGLFLVMGSVAGWAALTEILRSCYRGGVHRGGRQYQAGAAS